MSLFNSINHRENYYLGKSLNKIDKRLLSVRLPIELARSTRSLNERAYYKANEWRTILFVSEHSFVFGYFTSYGIQKFNSLCYFYAYSMSRADF